MTKRRAKQGPAASDFHAARGRLQDIGSGLSSVFDAVSQLIDDAGSDNTKTLEGKRLRTSFDVRMRTLDEVSAERSATPRPVAARPAAAEHHVSDDGIMVIVTLGRAKAQDVALVETQTGPALTCGLWRYAIPSSPPLALSHAARTLRNGYLTFQIPYTSPVPGDDTAT